MRWAFAALLYHPLLSASQDPLPTFHGWINPLKYFKEEDASVYTIGKLRDGDSLEDLQELVPFFLEHREEMDRQVNALGQHRVGNGLCNTDIATTDMRPHWERLRRHGVALSYKIVNIGASDGQSEDPLYDLVTKDGLTGVAVEASEARCAEFRQNVPGVTLRCETVTPYNAADLVLPHVGPAVDVLKLDIDSFDCAVLEELLPRLRSHLLLVEVNPGIPPPFRWAMRYHSGLSEFFSGLESMEHVPIRGCSLSYAVHLAARYGYDFLAFGHHDALFSHQSLRHVWDERPPLDEVRCYNESFVSLNGIPISLTRQWFFQGERHKTISDIWQFFLDWMQDHAGGRLFPFTLDS